MRGYMTRSDVRPIVMHTRTLRTDTDVHRQLATTLAMVTNAATLQPGIFGPGRQICHDPATDRPPISEQIKFWAHLDAICYAKKSTLGPPMTLFWSFVFQIG
jgi:hypothetical protein